MKKIYFGALAVAFAFSASAQSKQGLVKAAPQVMPEAAVKVISKNSEAYARLKKRAVWSEDFSNGFDGQGNNGAFTQAGLPTSKGTIPEWEYRGPATDPDVTVGSQGSCGGLPPIMSETASNGFVIFDSNGLDEPIPAQCAGSGSGPAPTPHNATLFTPSIDLSAQQSAQLFLSVNARNFQASVNVLVIADGDTTLVGDIYEILDLAANEASNNSDVVGIDISEAGGGRADVKIGIQFTGDYYYFMMDDMFIDAVPDYNYDIVDIYNDDITDYYEYLALPLSQTHLLQPGLSVTSKGAQTVDLTVSVSIEEPDGNIQGPFTMDLNGMVKDSTTDVMYIDTYTPTQVGAHVITFQVSSDFDDEDLNPANNIRTRNFTITEDIWSDAFSAGVASFQAPQVDNAPGTSEAFQIFYTFNDVTIYGMDYFIFNAATAPDAATFEGDEVQASVFNIDKDAFETAITTAGAATRKSELFTEASSTFLEAGIDDNAVISSAGAPVINTAAFPDAVTIPAENYFAVSIANSGGGFLRVVVTNPSTNSDLSGTVRARGLLADPGAVDDDELLFFGNVNPWVRARTALIDNIKDNSVSTLVGNAVPNPSNGNVRVAYSLINTADVSLTLTDLSGKVILTQNEGTQNAGSRTLNFDVSELNAGVYFYSVSIGGNTTTKKLVVTK